MPAGISLISLVERLPMESIAELCRRYDVNELAIFGSVLTPQFHQDSDIDLLVSFRNDNDGPWMSRLNDLQRELSALLNRPVDLVPRDSLKWVIRDRVLSDARVIYAEAMISISSI